MPLIAKEGSTTQRQLAPAGSHVARCYQVCDLGTQQGAFGAKHQVRISWELPDETAVFSEDKGEQPFTLHKTYTVSLHEKSTLRHELETWRGKPFTAEELKGFSIKKLLGAPCLLTVIHAEKGEKKYANVNSITPLVKGMTCPPAVNAPVFYEVEQGRDAVFNSLPSWLQEQIAACQEWKQKDADPDWDTAGEPAPDERPSDENVGF